MAPPPETRQASRIELVEEAVAALQSSLSREVTEAVNRAAADMQQTLVAQIATSLDQVTQRLHVRMDTVRDANETLIQDVRRRQEEFQSEIRSALTSLKTVDTTSKENHGEGAN
ncbi:hypothetical protein POM88_041168 [Heracleum sosnowskyi]|uniref:Uncharacterized protein n=1 Tax=Heracleum sosnowskyi TaxID=360622 RepID=A0AAD8HGA3_9APIA|nr:hypothetical protein POM88_041168 [Heracleum sosnowskyi]